MNILNKEHKHVLFTDSLPPLAIPSSKKDKEYYKKVMDTLEYIGSKQYIENHKYVDMERMRDGKANVKELKEVLPFLENFQAADVDNYTPRYIRHYDLFGQIINAATETYMLTRDDFFVHTTDVYSTNEFTRTRNQLMNTYLRQRFSVELDETLRNMGLETDLSLVQFDNEEQMVEYQDLTARTRQQLTPESIDNYMTQDFKLAASKWASYTMERDNLGDEETMIRENLSEYLMSGRAFRHLIVGYDYYGSEVWSTKEVFQSYEGDRKKPHKTEYIGRIKLFTASQLISRYGYLLSSKAIEILSKSSGFGQAEHNVMPPYLSEKWSSKTLPTLMPTADFEERCTTKAVENLTGIPHSILHGVDGDGNPLAIRGFSSEPFNATPRLPLYDYARFANNNTLRSDVYQVTEAYFTDYERMGLLCLENEYGAKILEYVTDDILKEFLDELGIKQIKRKSLDEFERNLEPNSILWYYKPYSRHGIKINLGMKDMDDFYFTEKTPYQLGQQNHMFDVVHPVIGINGDGMGDKLLVYQSNFNLCMNQISDFLEKEIGLFFLFDKSFLMQSDNEEDGDSNEAMELAVNIIKSLGYLGIDTSNAELQQAIAAGQFQPIDASLIKQFTSRIQLAQFYQQQAYNLIGVHVGQGAPADAYKTAQKDRSDREAMYAQLEHYFSPFTNFLAEVYTYRLSVAQYCQKTTKDITSVISLNDGQNTLLEFTDVNFPFRKFGVSVVSNAKERHKKNLAMQYLLSTNTLIDDPVTFLEIISDNTLASMADAANRSMEKKQQQIQVAQQNTLEQIEAKAEADRQLVYFDWYLQEQSKTKDREVKLLIEGLEATGRGLNSDASSALNAKIMRDQMDYSFQQTKLEAETSYKQASLREKERVSNRKLDIEERRLQQRDRELDSREKNRTSREVVAAVNKN